MVNLSPTITAKLLGTPSFAHAGLTSLRVSVPEGRRYDDEFYASNGELYRQLVEDGESPAVKLASANGVPVTTVHRWIRETRRRGFLPPGKKGAAG